MVDEFASENLVHRGVVPEGVEKLVKSGKVRVVQWSFLVDILEDDPFLGSKTPKKRVGAQINLLAEDL